jgi:ABC-type sugar transport system ATPase subunit
MSDARSLISPAHDWRRPLCASLTNEGRETNRLAWAQPLLGRSPRQLSGGQRQRFAMGRAIVRDPRVFLFDEPLSNLDAKLRVQVRGEIKELQRR